MQKLLIIRIVFFIILLSTQLCADDGIFSISKKIYNEGRYDSAKQICKEILNKPNLSEKQEIEGLILLAEIKLAASEYKNCEQLIKKAINHRFFKKTQRPGLLGQLYYLLWCTYYYKDNRQRAKESILKSLDLFSKDSSCFALQLSKVYNSLGLEYILDKKFDSAYVWFNNALHIQQQLNNKIELATTFGFLGQLFTYYKVDNLKGKKHHLKAKAILEAIYPNGHPKLINSYNHLIRVYSNLGDYKTSNLYIEKSLLLNEKFFKTKFNQYYASTLLQSAINSRRLRDYDNSISNYLKGIAILKKIGWEFNVDSYYKTAGLIYSLKKQYDSALKYQFKSLELYKKKRKDLNLYSYRWIAYCYEQLGEFALAEKYYFMGINQRVRLHSNYKGLANLYLKTKDYNKGLKYSQLALLMQCNWSLADSTNFIMNPPLKMAQSARHYIQVLSLKAKILSKLGNASHLTPLNHSLKTYSLALNAIDSLRHSFIFEENKLQVSLLVKSIIKNAFDVAIQLYSFTKEKKYLHQAYQITEKGKAASLYSGLLDINALKLGNIPDSLVELEHSLRITMSTIRTKIFKLTNSKTLQKEKVEKLKQRQFLYHERYDSLLNYLKNNYPHYYQLKYDQRFKSIPEIQQMLAVNQAIVSYYESDFAIHIFLIGRDRFIYKKTKIDSITLYNQIMTLRNTISTSSLINNPTQNWNQFLQYAQKLHQVLWEPIQSKIPNESEVIISTYGILSLIPFEILFPKQNSKVNLRQLDYLIYHHSISYTNSVNIWCQSVVKEQGRATNKVLAFAPSFDQATSLSVNNRSNALAPLVWTKKELNNISKYFKINALVDESATEWAFKSASQDYNILHIASHAVADDQRPMYSKIYFTPLESHQEDDALHVYELYDLSLNAELTVLSACNTGYGKVLQGEGVLNLARGFMYAGCPSIVMSLWNANDYTTTIIMDHFYEQLSLGKNKAEALRQAKIKYLQQADIFKTHPYFWAQFVATGDMRPIVKDNNRWEWIVFGILFTVCCFVMVQYLKKRNRRLKS